MRGAAAAIIEKASFALLLLTVALAPLPFGSNKPVLMAALSFASALCLAGTCLAVILDKNVPSQIFSSARVKFIAAAFGAAAVWVLIQLAPFMPASIAHPLWRHASDVLHTALPSRITINPDLTLEALTRTAGYFAIGIATFLLLLRKQRTRLACMLFIVAGALYALYGLVNWSFGIEKILWEDKTAFKGVVTGPFVNRNNFATYLGVVALVGIGYILRDFGDMHRLKAATRLDWLRVSAGLIFARQWGVILSLLCIFPALLLTLSRAGNVSFGLGAVTLLLLAARSEILPRVYRWIYVSLFVVMLGGTVAVFGDSLVERFSDIEDAHRTDSWSIMLDGIETSPLLGHGYGTFPEAFPLYRDDRLASRRYWDKAHNTYIELALDLGIPATLTVLAGFGGLAALYRSGLSRRRRERRLFPAIALSAMVLVGAHSLIDFSVQIPAVAIAFAFILGMGAAESLSQRRNGSSKSAQREVQFPLHEEESRNVASTGR